LCGNFSKRRRVLWSEEKFEKGFYAARNMRCWSVAVVVGFDHHTTGLLALPYNYY